MRATLSRFGLNVGVLVVSIAVFALAFLGLNAYGASLRPPQVEVLAATRRLQVGEVLGPRDLTALTVYQDQATGAYLPASVLSDTLGAVVTVPLSSGQPIPAGAVLARPSGVTRLAALLADQPGMSLMPLPLDRQNLVAPPVDAFLPGDLVDVTVVVDRRPLGEPAPLVAGGEVALPPTPTPAPLTSEPALVLPPDIETALQAALARLDPPVAKSLFSRGARVVAVYGLPPEPAPAEDAGDAAVLPPSGPQDSPLLLLLVPSAERERLSLALARGDLVVVSLLGRADAEPEETPGFSYDDLEQWLADERRRALEQALVEAGVLAPAEPLSSTQPVSATELPISTDAAETLPGESQ